MPRAAAIPLAAFVLASVPVLISAGSTRLIERSRPLTVRWGEVEVSETTRVKVTVREEETEYPNAVSLTFKSRERREDLESLRGEAAQASSRVSTAGTIWFAARAEGGSHVWAALVKELETEISRLTPANYDDFIKGFQMEVFGFQARKAEYEKLRVVYCTARPGEPEGGGEVFVTARKSPGSPPTYESGASVFKSGASPTCPPLQQAFQEVPASEVLTTGFMVDESLEESLDLRSASRRDQPPLALPEGASVSRRTVSEGATSFSSTQSKDGVVHAEMLRRDAARPSYVVTADVKDARLASGLPRGRSTVTRWEVGLRARHLGAPPRDLLEERHVLLVGIFCTTTDCSPDVDGLERAATEKLMVSEGLLGIVPLRMAMDASLFPADAFVVTCLPGKKGGKTASYCVSNACARVLNPEPVCNDIEQALPE